MEVFLVYDEADSKTPVRVARVDALGVGGVGTNLGVMFLLVVGGVVVMVSCVAGLMSVGKVVWV